MFEGYDLFLILFECGKFNQYVNIMMIDFYEALHAGQLGIFTYLSSYLVIISALWVNCRYDTHYGDKLRPEIEASGHKATT